MSDSDHQKYLRELRKRIRRVYRTADARGGDRISPGEEIRTIVTRHRRGLKSLPKDIELWFAFYDEATAFWFALWTMYFEKFMPAEGAESSAQPKDTLSICLMVLAGRVFQDLVCIREMIAGGFSVQANVVARSLVESIDVMHLLNSRPDIAEEFKNIETNEESSRFWHQYCSRDKIHKIVKARWLWFCEGDGDVAASFYEQRQDYLDITGMSVHPSFAASFTTFMDSSSDDAQNIFKTVMGSVSPMSKFAMHLILLRIFEYGILWVGPTIGMYRSGGEPGAKPTLYDNLSKGLSVMLSIVTSVGGGDEEKHPFFPEFETYWPRPGSMPK